MQTMDPIAATPEGALASPAAARNREPILRVLRAHLPAGQVDRIMALAADPARLDALPVDQFMNLYRI